MVLSDLPFEPRGRAWRVLLLPLSEAFLGFLAIMSAAFTLIPMLFVVRPEVDRLLEAGQWMIIGLFAIEYGLGLSFARKKEAFLVNPWRLLDLLTIVVPLATLMPQVSSVLMSSPVLRLVRLVRVITLGLRASGVVVREETRRAMASVTGPVEVAVLRAGEPQAPQAASWEEFLRRVKTPGEEWYDVSNLGPEQLRQVALALGLAPAYVESHLCGASYPHLELADRHASLFVWLPELSQAPQTERHGLLLLATGQSVFTLSRRPSGLLRVVAEALPRLNLGALPFPVGMTCAFLKAVLDLNEIIVGRFERELRALEEVPVRESRPPFFEQTFRLKKELSTAQSDLWRLKGILTALAESRLKLPGGGSGEKEVFAELAESADYLYETVVNTREGVMLLIELHLNVVSFEMNRVMRVLAVVSVLGLIPAVIGGLLGMNLADNPWPFTLPQVAFGVCLGMVVCLYLFLVKGWLR